MAVVTGITRKYEDVLTLTVPLSIHVPRFEPLGRPLRLLRGHPAVYHKLDAGHE